MANKSLANGVESKEYLAAAGAENAATAQRRRSAFAKRREAAFAEMGRRVSTIKLRKGQCITAYTRRVDCSCNEWNGVYKL